MRASERRSDKPLGGGLEPPRDAGRRARYEAMVELAGELELQEDLGILWRLTGVTLEL